MMGTPKFISMTDKNMLEPNEYDNYEVDLRELFGVIWNSKILIGSIISVFLVLAIYFAINTPNIYRSNALLAPAEESTSFSGAFQGLSGLAGLAGINIPPGGSSQAEKAIKVMSSMKFFREKILTNIYLPDLMANPRWDPVTNTLSYDSDLFDIESNKWVRKVAFPYKANPSDQEAFEFFQEIFSVSSDKVTGFITISVKHVSPHIAKKWALIIIDEINSQFREEDRAMALSSIQYLNNQISTTSVVEVRQALSELLQSQIQTSMLTDAKKDYVFSVIDPPFSPEVKDQPNRFIIVILGVIFGSVIGSVISIYRFYNSRYASNNE